MPKLRPRAPGLDQFGGIAAIEARVREHAMDDRATALVAKVERRTIKALTALRNDLARQIAEAVVELWNLLTARNTVDRRLVGQVSTFGEYSQSVLKDGGDHGETT